MDLDSQKSYTIKSLKPNFIYRVMKALFPKENITEAAIGDSDVDELIESIKNAWRDWMCANLNFNYANEQEVVDYYTYMIKACQVRYEYLIREAKEKGIKVGVKEFANVISYCGEAIN